MISILFVLLAVFVMLFPMDKYIECTDDKKNNAEGCLCVLYKLILRMALTPYELVKFCLCTFLQGLEEMKLATCGSSNFLETKSSCSLFKTEIKEEDTKKKCFDFKACSKKFSNIFKKPAQSSSLSETTNKVEGQKVKSEDSKPKISKSKNFKPKVTKPEDPKNSKPKVSKLKDSTSSKSKTMCTKCNEKNIECQEDCPKLKK